MTDVEVSSVELSWQRSIDQGALQGVFAMPCHGSIEVMQKFDIMEERYNED